MNDRVEYIMEIFRMFGRVTVRRMLAGHEIFRDGLMFAILYDETLYLKADPKNIVYFQDEGFEQLAYTRQGKRVGLSYYRAPELVLEAPHEAARWANRSYEAAIRAEPSHSAKRRT